MKWWKHVSKVEIEKLDERGRDWISRKLAWWKSIEETEFWPDLARAFPDDPRKFYDECIERGAFIYEAKARFELHDGNSYNWPRYQHGPFGEVGFRDLVVIATGLSFEMSTRVCWGNPELETETIKFDSGDGAERTQSFQTLLRGPGWTPMIQFNLGESNTTLKRCFEGFIEEQRNIQRVKKRAKALCWKGLEAFDWIQIHPEKIPSSTQKKEIQRAKTQFVEMYSS